MKSGLSKAITSPGRADKFPPPLLRFLRSNVGSRSTKGRSRASPMFFIRHNKKSLTETVQEPSSPKVTCIGQVRVRRSKKKTTIVKKKPRIKPRRRFGFCCWLKKPVLCCKICPAFRLKWRRPFRGFCGKWASFFRFGYCKKVDATEDSIKAVSCSDTNNNDQKSEKTETLVVLSGNEDGLIEESKRDSIDLCSSSTPPKNAFLLTRCRSAPYRSSSLGGRFWGSPVKQEEGNESEEESSKLEESDTTSCASSVVVEVEGSRSSEEESGKEEEKIVVVDNLKGIASVGIGSVAHPLLLTRCKSEPAKTGERLVPEANFWKQRRSGVVEPCSSHHNNS